MLHLPVTYRYSQYFIKNTELITVYCLKDQGKQTFKNVFLFILLLRKISILNARFFGVRTQMNISVDILIYVYAYYLLSINKTFYTTSVWENKILRFFQSYEFIFSKVKSIKEGNNPKNLKPQAESKQGKYLGSTVLVVLHCTHNCWHCSKTP